MEIRSNYPCYRTITVPIQGRREAAGSSCGGRRPPQGGRSARNCESVTEGNGASISDWSRCAFSGSRVCVAIAYKWPETLTKMNQGGGYTVIKSSINYAALDMNWVLRAFGWSPFFETIQCQLYSALLKFIPSSCPIPQCDQSFLVLVLPLYEGEPRVHLAMRLGQSFLLEAPGFSMRKKGRSVNLSRAKEGRNPGVGH